MKNGDDDKEDKEVRDKGVDETLHQEMDVIIHQDQEIDDHEEVSVFHGMASGHFDLGHLDLELEDDSVILTLDLELE